jgi:preprotein translocase subunit SecY
MGGKRSHLPLKLNFSGVIPPIFASSLLMFPATVAQFVNQPWLKDIQGSLTPTGSIYNILFIKKWSPEADGPEQTYDS